MATNTIAMLGAGTMGQGITWALAAAGKKVVLYDIKIEFVERSINAIGKGLSKAEVKGKAEPGTKDKVLANISGTDKFEDLKNVDFIIEAVFENDTALSIEADMFGLCCSTADQKEGMKAFLKKRKPVFSGKVINDFKEVV